MRKPPTLKVFFMELAILLLITMFGIVPFITLLGIPDIITFPLLFLLGWNWNKLCPLMFPFLYGKNDEKPTK